MSKEESDVDDLPELPDMAELQSAQVLKIAPDTIVSIGEDLKQILQQVAHLF